MSLGRETLLDTKAAFAKIKQQEQLQEEGTSCQLVFKLPNGEQAALHFKAGHTIAFVKLQLQNAFGYRMDSLKLVSNGRLLIDPLSIADYPQLLSSEAIEVLQS